MNITSALFCDHLVDLEGLVYLDESSSLEQEYRVVRFVYCMLVPSNHSDCVA